MGIVAEVINKITPLVLVGLGTSRLGIEAYGFSQLGMVLMEVFVPFVTFGYTMQSIMRAKQALSDSRPEDIQRCVGEILALRAIHFVLTLVGLYYYVAMVLNEPMLFAVLAVALTTSVLELTFINFALQKLHLLSITTIVSKVFNLVIVYFGVDSATDKYTFLIAALFANGLIGLVSFLYGIRQFPPLWPNSARLKSVGRSSLPYGLYFVLYSLNGRLDVLLVESNLGLAKTGFYTALLKLYHAITPLVMMLGNVFFAESIAANSPQKETQLLKTSLGIVMTALYPLVVGTWFVSDKILALILGSDFSEGSHLFNVMIVSLLGTAITTIITQQVYLKAHYVWKLALFSLIWTPVLWGAYSFLSSRFELMGVTLGVSIYWSLCGILMMLYLSRQRIHLYREAATGAFPALIMGVVLYLFSERLSLPETIFLGIMIYLIALRVVHPKIFRR